MTSLRLLAALFIALLAFAIPQASRAEEFSAQQRSAIEKIVREYLVSNPQVLQEVMTELEKRQVTADAEKSKTAVKQNAQALFNAPNQVTLGNPKGDVTFVEFYDYNCSYCKRAMPDMFALMKDDSNLKVVLKEFPVLGPGSVEAARVGVAVHMQDPSGKKYLEFHQKLLGGRGQADGARALAVAKQIGVDMNRLQIELKSPQVEAQLQRDYKLGLALGLNGTPSYVIGEEVVVGAVGLATLREKINNARCGKATC